MSFYTRKRILIVFLFLSIKMLGQSSLHIERKEAPVLELKYPIPDSIQLPRYTRCFVDTTAVLTFQDIQNQYFEPLFVVNKSFKPNTQSNCQLKRYWLRLNVSNLTADSLTRILQFSKFDSLDIYIFQNNHLIAQDQIGHLRPRQNTRQSGFIHSKNATFIKLPPQSKLDIWIKGQKSYCLSPIEITLLHPLSEAYFLDPNLKWINAWNYAFLGILLIVMLNTLMFYFQYKDTVFLYYLGYIAAHFLYFWYAFEDNNPFSQILPPIFFKYVFFFPIAGLWQPFYLFFLAEFFNTKQKYPEVHFWLRLTLWLVIFTLILDRLNTVLSFNFTIENIWKFKLGLTILSIFLIIFLFRKLKADPLVNYILTGSILFAVGTLLLRVIPDSASPYWGTSLIYQQIGILAELMCFSMGLAYKTKLETVQKERLLTENAQLQLSKELDLAILRNQIAQDIHDEIGSGLTKISLNAQVATRLSDLTADEFRERLSKIDSDARILGSQMREVIFAINPEYDNFDDLQAYFKEYARDFWAESGIEPVFDFEKSNSNPIVSPQIKRQLLLIFKEAQNNAAKYAQATDIRITLKINEINQFLLEIQDNGKGFEIDRLKGFSKGLSGMKQRAASIDAILTIESQIGKGTTVKVMGQLS